MVMYLLVFLEVVSKHWYRKS